MDLNHDRNTLTGSEVHPYILAALDVKGRFGFVTEEREVHFFSVFGPFSEVCKHVFNGIPIILTF